MTKAVRFHKTGGPEVLQVDDVQVGDPGEGQARVKHSAIGLNFIDTYHRSGLYPLPLPSGVGLEAVGVVEAVGAGVTHVKPGDRVGYAGGPPGAYSEVRLIPADRLVKVPGGISDKEVAAMMLKGLTVQYLIRRVYRVEKGETVLFHAAAGGVGLIACQWLKALGVTVIGTVGSDEKAKIAKAHGCDHTIVYTRENFTDRVKQITGGAKVPVVFDSVGKDTFMGSLDCLKPRGLLAVFGNGSGPVAAFDLNMLAAKGSLYVTRPTLMTYTARREDLEAAAKELFDVVKSGKVKIEINQTYKLGDAAQAHRDLEGRKTTGSTVLQP
ncbi:MAG TPA: quinone oxidoreductase, partial [Burkholderiales bacterium]|jgi:NADPH2:quinone reductase|nr:quinone oxidoreductase [Burkholderiales bacterium]